MKFSKIILLVTVLGMAMSCGVHRVAQSRWNCPQAGRNTKLSFYFTLDNALPAAGFLHVGIPSAAGLTPTVCSVWTLADSWTAPTTVENVGTLTFANNVMACTFASALAANTAYGLEITVTATTTVGSFAPVTMQTRMNNAADAGPIIDTNWVFDQIVVNAAPLAMTLTATKVVTDPVKEFPGETAAVDFVWTFASSVAATPFTPVTGTSFMVHLQLGAATTDRAAATDTAVQLYPIDYEDWKWTATCVNVQFGNNSEDTTVTPHPKLAADPTCTDTNGELTFVVPQLPTSTDWSTWSMKFTISVTMPSDRILQSTTVDSWFSDLADEQVYAVAPQVSSFMAISKPTTAVTAAGLVSFGKDPNDTTQQGQGVGVYSSVFCISTNAVLSDTDWSSDTVSNCAITSATTADTLAAATSTATVGLPQVNAIELEFTIPYAIPNDRTEASMICALDNLVAPTTVPTRFANDPMTVFSSSLVTNNMGTANCFYNGVLNTNAAVGQHRFVCTNIGAISTGTKIGMAFQFSLNNAGKTINMAASATNSVQTAITTLTCTMKVNTWTSDTASSVEWVSQAYTTKVDGAGQTSKFGEYSSFVGTAQTQSAVAQHEDTQVQEADNQNIELWIVLHIKDKLGADTNAFREFPWPGVLDTSAAALDYRAYGVGLQADATLTITAPAAYDASASYKCVIHAGTRDTCIDWGTGVAAKAAEASPPTGMIAFQLAAGAWGGSCCTNGAECAGGAASNSAASCDKLNPVVNGASSVYAHPFMQILNVDQNAPVHSLTKAAAAGTVQSITVWKLNNAMLMPAYLTTFRGRGGWGAGDSNQKLMDVFIQMRSAAASSPSIQVLSHFYIGAKAANDLTDTNANVKVSFPLGTYATPAAAATVEGQNDGASVLNTGVKLFVAAGASPVTTHLGFFTVRMQPFFKSTGANQVEVVVTGTRSVSCWHYSSEDGSGFCYKNDNEWLAYFTGEDLLYRETIMFGAMGLMICEVGTAAGTTTLGDAIIIPTLQAAYPSDLATMALPGIGTNADATAGLAAYPINNVAGAVSCANGFGGGHAAIRLMMSSDANLYSMTRIADGSASALDDITQADQVVGTTGNAWTTWYSTTTTAQYNDNDGNNNEFDIDGVDGTHWIYGNTGIASQLSWKNEGPITFSHVQDAMVICTPVTGSALPAALVMTSGTDGNGQACTAVFAYTYMVSTTRYHRQCRWCAATFATPNVKVHLASYDPPALPERTITGVSIWGVEGTTGDNSYYTPDATKTTERLIPTAAVAGTCGANPATILQSTNAQSVSFTFKTPVPLASGQSVIWDETTATGNVGWAITTIPTDSVTCTCVGHTTWTQAQSNGFVRTSAQRFTLTIPDLASTDGSEVTCTAGDVVCTVNGWNAGVAPANDLTATCFACDAVSGSADCTTTESATAGNTGQGVVSYDAAATVTYKQSGTADATVLSIKDVGYYPNSKTARGRLSYKLKDTATAYGAYTTVAYTFGGQTFGTGAQCQIYAESTEQRGWPGETMLSDRVSNCVISGSQVTITLASNKVDFHVAIVAMDAWLASDTNKVTGTQSNFGGSVRTTTTTTADQYQMVTATLLGDNKSRLNSKTSNTPTVGEVVLTRSLTNIMDLGMLQFKITVKGTYSLDGDSYVMISFPSYYNPGLGNNAMPRCVWRDAENAADAETVWCYTCWDWQLMVRGPKTAVATAGFGYLRIFNVAMNSFATAGTFGVGLMNHTSHTNMQVNEYGEVTDGTTGAWGGVLPITVNSVVTSSSQMRSTTTVTLEFTLPTTTGTVTEGADYVALMLPWMANTWHDGSAVPGVKLELKETAADSTVTKTEAAGALEMVAGCGFVYKLATDATKMAETKTYILTVKNVPTQSNSAAALTQNLRNYVLSVGLMASGGKGYSHAQNMAPLAKAAVATGNQLLDFTTAKVAINRGTYSLNALCVKPGVANQNFQGDFKWKSASSNFKTIPATVQGKMGDQTSCAALGAASAVSASTHFSYWSVEGKNMSPLPPMMVTVGRAQSNVNVPSAVTCYQGGSSFPMGVTLAAQPFTDVKVALAIDEDKSDAANVINNSYGATINAASLAGIQFGSSTTEAFLGFTCTDTANATSLKYVLSGTDAANFKLSSLTAAVTVEKKVTGAAPTKTITVAMVADSSTAGSVTVEGACPNMGASIIHWAPADKGMVAAADWKTVNAAYEKSQTQKKDPETAYLGEQYCYKAVASTGAKTTCAFDSQSLGKYNATLYCNTIQGWFYASAVAKVTAPDNGGAAVQMTLTYKKAIDVKKDNAVILNVCGALAENVQVPYKRVQDELGGFKGSPSPMLGKRMLQAATTTAAANNTTNATVQTEWKVEIFVQPDPRAAAVVPEDMVTKLKDPSALAAINTITSAKYGAPTVVAAKIVEAAVAWKTNPAGKGGEGQITVAGSMTATGYVYCAEVAAAKTRLLQNNKTETAKDVPTKDANATAAKPKVVWTRAKTVLNTKNNEHQFAIVMKGKAGAEISWTCMGTSANNDMMLAKYQTTKFSGKTSVNAAPAPPAVNNASASAASDSALMSSLFAAIIMIVAVFFY